MSTHSQGQSGRLPSAVIRVPTMLDGLLQPGSLGMIGLLFLGIGLLFKRWFLAQHEHSWGNGDWSHAYLIPLISGYLLWQNKEGLARTTPRVFWPGALMLAMGIWCYIFFLVGVPNHFGQGLSLVLTIFGVVLLLTGPEVMQYTFWPIAYLVFGITIPEMIMNLLTYPLQDITAKGGYVILQMSGVSADRAGNVITIILSNGDPHPLNVAEQCAGMRMVIAFIALGTAVALVGTKLWWKRVVLVGLAVPIAVFLNMFRVAVLGWVSFINTNLSTGESHTFIGTLLLIPGFFLYMGVIAAMNKAVPEGESAKAAPKAISAVRGNT